MAIGQIHETQSRKCHADTGLIAASASRTLWSMSSFLSALWPVSARMHPDKPGVLQAKIGWADWPEQVVVNEWEIADADRQPWLAMSRAHPPRAAKIGRAIAAVDLVPAAVSIVLRRLPMMFGGHRDARKRVPGSEAYFARVRKRLKLRLQVVDDLLPPDSIPTKDSIATVVRVEFKTDAKPLDEPLLQELLRTIRRDVDILIAMESDPATADTGRFLELTLDRLRITPLDLSFVLQHHPEALSALRRRETTGRLALVSIAEWIRKMVNRSRKRPAKRPLKTRGWWSKTP